MPAELPNTTTTDRFQDTTLGGGSLFARGALVIANNPVAIQVTTAFETGQERTAVYPYITPTTFPLTSGDFSGQQRGKVERIVGVQIKSAVAGSPAQVSGWLIEPGLAGPDIGSAFTSRVSATGAITPGLSSVQIQHDGTLIGTEPILDFQDGNTSAWVDDPANTRVIITAPRITTSTWASGPPALPTSGDIWIATNVDNTFNMHWVFQAELDGGYSWKFLGGPKKQISLLNVNAVMNTLTSPDGGSHYFYPGLMSTTMPRLGDWQISGQIQFFQNGGPNGDCQLVPHYNGALVPAGFAVVDWSTTGSSGPSLSYETPVSGVAAGNVFGICGNAVAMGTYKFGFVSMFVQPIRIG